MNKYKLNFLRWLTKGEVPDNMLKTAIDFKIDDDGMDTWFSFKCKAKANFKNWRCIQGTCNN